MLDKLKAGATFADVAAADGSRSKPRPGSSAASHRPPLSAATCRRHLPDRQGRRPRAEAAQPAEQVVFRVTDIVVPTSTPRSETPSASKDTLNRALSEDVAPNMSAALETEIGVTINQSALNQVVGGGGTTN